MFKIVRMSKEHLDDIMIVENLSFSSPWSKKSFETELENDSAVYFAAVDGSERAVAYGGFWLVCGEGQITNIAVHPDFRERGIGKKILLEMIENAIGSGAQSITLEVRQSNAAAQKLYSGLGFKNVGMRKRYYADGENALLMTKKLR